MLRKLTFSANELCVKVQQGTSGRVMSSLPCLASFPGSSVWAESLGTKLYLALQEEKVEFIG